MIEKPIGPQLQIPADAPIIAPTILPPIFVVLFRRVLDSVNVHEELQLPT